MRNTIWYSCVVGVATAALVYGMARFADKHPECPAARCCRACWLAATDWNPLVKTGRLVGSQVAGVFQRTRPIAVPTSKCPQPACTMHPPADTSCIRQVIDLTSYEELNRDAPEACRPVPEFVGETETVPPGLIEDQDPVKPMPLCDDDDACDNSRPLQNDDQLEPDVVIQQVKPNTTPELLPMPEAVETADEPGDPEESESMNDGMPPDCQEDPDYHQRYPECPYSGGCPGSRHCPAPTVPAQKPVPEKKTGDAEVDTMEVRPSDVQTGEFEAKPTR